MAANRQTTSSTPNSKAKGAKAPVGKSPIKKLKGDKPSPAPKVSRVSAKSLAPVAPKAKSKPAVVASTSAKNGKSSVHLGKATPAGKKAAANSKSKMPGAVVSVSTQTDVDKAREALKAQIPSVAPKKVRKATVMEANIGEGSSALSSKWNSLYRKSQQMEVKPYNMMAAFEEKTAILHKVLGWGYILTNRNDRLEVLFKDGIKYLISNYKRE